jgi:Protein of unknown function (DUF1161)
MKSLVVAACVCFAAVPAIAQTKQCEELKAEIDKKIQANGVKNYTLEIVETGKVKDEKVVGTCDGGTKKITYTVKSG